MGRRATNADDKGKGKASIRCFKCNEYGHISSECRKGQIHVAEREESDTPSYVADDDRLEFDKSESDKSESDNDTIYGDGGQSLMIHKTLFLRKQLLKLICFALASTALHALSRTANATRSWMGVVVRMLYHGKSSTSSNSRQKSIQHRTSFDGSSAVMRYQ